MNRKKKCVICSKDILDGHHLFCSHRCEQIDLYKWFSGEYSVEAIELDDVSEEDIQSLENSIIEQGK